MFRLKKIGFSIVLFFFCVITTVAQNKIEREHRILKSQFPEIRYAKETLGDNVKKIKYYKEVGTENVVFTAKFKKVKLHYQMQYSSEGDLQNIGFRVEELDFPAEVLLNIKSQFNSSLENYKIRRMYQQYPVTSKEDEESVFKSAFQNLITSSIEYKFVVKGKKDGDKVYKEFWFNADGALLRARNMLPANFDRVLY
ncbi:hypothetical protein [Cellulophaga fucicola]|uniref:Uncharacterized protein n=1 Tax=Cellulophaga fucicola TaxID=76595 RepID=A0A1K1QJJ5_9FLAO|nr:hypothetical protein [Cellulophaga fucicola]SFW59803.1 hypothetical protein SAMN05660313_02677 [Cellulophaga fucicola]